MLTVSLLWNEVCRREAHTRVLLPRLAALSLRRSCGSRLRLLTRVLRHSCHLDESNAACEKICARVEKSKSFQLGSLLYYVDRVRCNLTFEVLNGRENKRGNNWGDA